MIRKTLACTLMAGTLALAACGDSGTEEGVDENSVEGAAEDTMQAAEGAGDAMAPAEGAGDSMQAATDEAFDEAEQKADETAETVEEAAE